LPFGPLVTSFVGSPPQLDVPTSSGRNQMMKSDSSSDTEITSTPEATSAKAAPGG